MFCVKNKLGLFGAKNEPKLQIRETFTAASKVDGSLFSEFQR